MKYYRFVFPLLVVLVIVIAACVSNNLAFRDMDMRRLGLESANVITPIAAVSAYNTQYEALSKLSSGLHASSPQVYDPTSSLVINLITNYQVSGYQLSTTSSSPTPISPVTQVNQTNTYGAPWFLTCPLKPTDFPIDQRYFYTYPYTGQYPNVAGNACENSVATLQTTITLNTVINWDLTHFAQATVQPIVIDNAGALGMKNIAYNPAVDNELSNGFSTSSYIFKQVPSFAQHDIWTWTAVFADFSQVPIPSSNTFTQTGIQYQTGPFTVTWICGTNPITGLPITCSAQYYCEYLYDYTETTTLTGIADNYIPYTEVIGQLRNGDLDTLTFDANVLPYFLYNYNITMRPPISPINPNLSQLSYDVYGPWSYHSPGNYIDQFPVNVLGTFIVNYSENGAAKLTNFPEYEVGIGAGLTSFGLLGNSSYKRVGVYTSTGTCPTTSYQGDTTSTISVDDAMQCAADAGFTGNAQYIIVAIAEAESSLHPGEYAYNGGYCPPSSGPFAGQPNIDRGVLQENNCYQPQISDQCAYTPSCAFQMAYTQVSNSGTNFLPWCTYDPYCNPSSTATGAYCQYMPTFYSGPYCPQGGGINVQGGTLPPGGTPPPPPTAGTPATEPIVIQNPISIAALPNDYLFLLAGAQAAGAPPPPPPPPPGGGGPGGSGAPAIAIPWQNFNPINSETKCWHDPTQPPPLGYPSGAGASACQSIIAGYYGDAGNDYGIAEGTPVYAIFSGTITWADWPAYNGQSWSGNCGDREILTIDGGGGWAIGYQHLLTTIVGPGGSVHVQAGQVIGSVGGNPADSNCDNQLLSSGPHLELQFISPQPLPNAKDPATGWTIDGNGKYIDPRAFLLKLYQVSQANGGQGGTPNGVDPIPNANPCDVWNAEFTGPTAVDHGYSMTPPPACPTGGSGSSTTTTVSPPGGGNGNCNGSDCYLYFLRIIPHGYYNTSSIPPSSVRFSGQTYTQCTNEPDCLNAWNSAWDKYWNTIIQQQDGTLYSVGGVDLTKILETPSLQSGTTTKVTDFYPFNISTDGNGDLYIIGSGFTTTTVTRGSILARVTNTIYGQPLCSQSPNTPNCISVSVAIVPKEKYKYAPTEVAVSPDGELVYLTNTEDGQVYVWSGGGGLSSNPTGSGMSYLNTIDLSFSKTPPQLLPGQKTPVVEALDITYWLSHGGLYNVSNPNCVSNCPNNLNWVNGQIQNQNDVFDSTGRHHAIGIANINGYLFVLDDWRGLVGSNCIANLFCSGGVMFNMLMLRAINSSGYDVPISPTFFNDVWTQQTCSSAGLSQDCETSPPGGGCSPSCTPEPVLDCGDLGAPGYVYQCVNLGTQSTTYYSLASVSSYLNNTYPPFGWILSANITNLDGSTKTTFCSSSQCDYSPYHMPSDYHGGYYPIAPSLVSVDNYNRIRGWGQCVSGHIHCVSPSLKGVGFGVNFNYTVSIFIPPQSSAPDSDDHKRGYSSQYDELLFTRFNVENYTKYFSGTQAYQCWTDSVKDSLYAGSPPGACYPTPFGQGFAQGFSVSAMHAPIYEMSNPFEYAESAGSQTILSYANSFYSTFTGGGGAPGPVIGGQSCTSQVQAGQTATSCFPSGTPQPPGGIDINSLINGNPLGSSPLSTTPQTPSLSSYLNGNILVPYKYSTMLHQVWYNFQNLGPSPNVDHGASCASISHSQPDVNNEVWGYAVINARSDSLSSVIEGGSAYLQYRNNNNNDYYIPNLSDIGSYIAPQILFNMSNDRWFGELYVNVTVNGNSNDQVVLNATEQLQYVANFNRIGPYLEYDTVSSQPVGPYYGAYYIQPEPNSVRAPSVRPFGFYYAQTPAQSPQFGKVILFDWYKQEVYDSPLNLYINGTYYGYQRLVYVYNDRFNNTVYMPLDADVANITTLTLAVNPTVDVKNANDTQLQINGSAGFYNYLLPQQFIPLKDQPVYIYYIADINYVGLSPIDDVLCAFGNPANAIYGYPQQCVLSDPTWTGRQSGSDQINYAPSYNGVGSCSPPPNSLLAPIAFDCNIYGFDGKSYVQQACGGGGSGQQQYCLPYFDNGTGLCTSQLGLMGIATTNTMGNFTFKTTACGNGEEKITAKYYGRSATPEPLTATQAPLGISADPTVPNSQCPPYQILSAKQRCSVTFQVVNYDWSPNATVTGTQIGLFELRYGRIGAAEIIGIASIAIMILLLMNRRVSKSNNKKMGKGSRIQK